MTVTGTVSEIATTGSEFDGTLTGSGVFIKSGPGTLVLTNSGTSLNGTVRIGQGVLQLNNSMALAVPTLDMNAADAGSLSTGASVTSLNLGGLMARNLALPAIPLTIGGNGSSTTYTGNITGATSLTKIGSGLRYLNGADSNGNTTVSQDALEAGGAAALSGYSTLNAVSVANGATLIVPTGNGVNGWSSSQINTLLQNVSLAPPRSSASIPAAATPPTRAPFPWR